MSSSYQDDKVSGKANPDDSVQAAISLLPVNISPEVSLLHVLQTRASSREFSRRPLSLQTMSNLLWAAFGINRPNGVSHRTAPSAKNWQEIDIYVALPEGLFVFDPLAFCLQPKLKTDVRPATGWQDFVADVPLNLIYVANLAKMDNAPREEQKFYAALDTGFISQNVYLYCAAAGLATVVRGWVDRPVLAQIMRLKPDQRVILAQSVGYPLP